MFGHAKAIATAQLIQTNDQDIEIPEEFEFVSGSSNSHFNQNQHSKLLTCAKNASQRIEKQNKINKKRLTMGLNSYKDIKSAYLTSNASQKASNKKGKNECTFTPKTNTNKKQLRTFSQFIDSQEKFMEEKCAKVEKLKTEMTQRENNYWTGTPNIDGKSRRISEEAGSGKNKSTVFQRLSKNKQFKLEECLNQSMFTPKILDKSKSLTRTDRVDKLLYDDAQRRNLQKKMIESELSKTMGSSKKSLKGVNINKNTNALVCRKIWAEFLQLIQMDGELTSSHKISPIMAITILSELFNVELNPNKDEKLCEKVVGFLVSEEDNDGEDEGSVGIGDIPIKKLWNFIQVIIGVNSDCTYFSQAEQLNINEELNHFYAQRIGKAPKRATGKNEQSGHIIETSQKTAQLAEIYREKKLQQLSEFVNENIAEGISSEFQKAQVIRLQDLFLLDSIRKRAELKHKKIEKDQKEMKECSFRPSLNEKRIQKLLEQRSRSKENSSASKLQSLSQAKIKNECSRSSQLIQQAQETQCSSNTQDANKVGKRKRKIMLKQAGHENGEEIKNVDKTILRLTIGRKIRQFEQRQRERGYAESNQNWLLRKRGDRNKVLGEIQNFKGYAYKDQYEGKGEYLLTDNTCI